MFRKVLVANRGEIACRILRTLRRLGVPSVAVYSDADRHAAHVRLADEAVHIGASPVAQSYLKQDALLAAARSTGAEAIHPGYGFLSENAAFAEACAAAGVAFIGPTPSQIREFGLKHTARDIAERSGVPLLPGSGLLSGVEEALDEAARVGYPVMLKSTAGGGGIGMQLVREESGLRAAFESVDRLAQKNFSRGGVFLERFIENARHIEVQIFGDGKGRVIALGERDCSVQRRNQKLIEETPAPGISAELRAQLAACAIQLGEAVGYRSAGTVEFVFDARSREFFFLEVNTRLQVEHGVTEAVTGVDLVEWMLRAAAGENFVFEAPAPAGVSIEVRVYAENPARGFRPSSGLLTHVEFPVDARVDTWVEDGVDITPHYDPLLAKIIVHGTNRQAALHSLRSALQSTQLAGIETNLEYLRQLVSGPEFSAGGMTTRALDSFPYAPRCIEVLNAGTQTMVQDYPGRLGFWNVGVPPSGPMDSLSFRLANRAVGNSGDAAALEITLSGPTLKFEVETVVCLAGAAMPAEVDGRGIEFWTPVTIPAGAILRIGAAKGVGCRAYLAVRGGLDVPPYLGSRATFTLGRFGGHSGRALLAGDTLHVKEAGDCDDPKAVPAEVIPAIENHWTLAVLDGPQGAPDFFTDADIESFFGAVWTVHYNSSRTGIRLIGPKPAWARKDGGEAGLHPSNIHDNAYAIGAVDFTGDMPVILGPDGPSLGGFVCPATVIKAELWKLGQLRADSKVTFKRIGPEEALELEQKQESMIDRLSAPQEVATKTRAGADGSVVVGGSTPTSPILGESAALDTRPKVLYRRAGDSNILVEYGPPVLDIELRLHVHSLMRWLENSQVEGIIDLTPGIRSLQVHYDNRILKLSRLVELLRRGEEVRPRIDDMTVPSRVVRMPLSWDDHSTQLAIAKYMQSVRNDAPWCPSNIEFIRRINGLESIDEVKRILFEASYLVLGLGDVYLGAPVATPLDPRHRLVTTKYNPARTWTPENAVGIGGAYLCVYGMEGPGGYQFVGRTCQVWNTYKVTAEFVENRPWLLRFFDRIHFYPVSAEELLDFRSDFLHGSAHLDIKDGAFRLADYREFLANNVTDIAAHKVRQQLAFTAERARWESTGQIGYTAELPELQADGETVELRSDCMAVTSPVAGNVWRVASAVGQRVNAGDTLVMLESMKTEMAVTAPVDAVVEELRCAEGRSVLFAQTLVVLRVINRAVA
jgi:urea carboxylase